MPSKKKSVIGKKTNINKGGLYCKIELPPMTYFRSKSKTISPYEKFYSWLRRSLETNNSGRLYKILYPKVKVAMGNSELNLDITKIVLNGKDCEDLDELVRQWAIKNKLTTKKKSDIFLGIHVLCYSPTCSKKLGPGFVYIEHGALIKE